MCLKEMLSTPKKSEKKAPNPKKGAPKSVASAWDSALLPFIEHPESFPEEVIQMSADLVIIKDKYPKAKHHFLLLPRPSRIGFSDLTRDDLPWISSLKRAAQRLIFRFRSFLSSHLISSLTQFAISGCSMRSRRKKRDLIDCGKKKHWKLFRIQDWISRNSKHEV